MKILVTGITGFIGGHLSKRLVLDGHRLFTVIRNSDQEDEFKSRNISCFINKGSMSALLEFFDMANLDGVIHCASHFATEHTSKEIEDLIMSNVLYSTTLLEASVKSGVSWFINTGTFWQHYQDKDYSPVNLYAATKQAFESIAQYYLEMYDINLITLKLNDTFGPEDTRPKIFNLWKKAIETGEILHMSKGEQYIDIVYIDDVVDAYVTLIGLLQEDNEKRLQGKSFAVSSDNQMRLRDLATVFESVVGEKLNIMWGERPYRKREVMQPWSKGKKIPGWKPNVSLEEGIAAILRNPDIE
jgi:CDP-paratose synthetase